MNVFADPFRTSNDPIFPLPLEPFEEYLLRDESPYYSMTWGYEWHFKGQVDKNALEQAFRETLEQEPLLQSQIETRRGKSYWIPSQQPPEWIWNDYRGQTFAFAHSGKMKVVRLDVQKGSAMRIEADCYDAAFILRIYVHHSVADGIGIANFAANWFSRYANLLGDTDGVQPFPPQKERIKERGRLHITLPEPVPFSRQLKSLVVEASKWFWRRPFSLKRNRVSAQTHSVAFQDLTPIPCWRDISSEVFAAYRAKAKSRNVSVNSLLLRDMFLFLRQWADKERPETSAGKYFRILTPINMRNEFHKTIPTSNILGYVFLDRKPQDCNADSKFLETIHQDMKRILSWSIGAMFLDGVRFFRKIPFALGFLASRRFCHSTTVLSNPGLFCLGLPQERFQKEKTIRVADLTLWRLVGAPPVRPHTPASFGFISCADQTTITMNCERSYFESQQAEQFLDGFIEFLQQSHVDE
ncbi:MAG: hypothetical protein LBT05_02200 [Planctomycetaceae bacterium]|jgi:NRPS condensation-like uncharacterized protein|nr:hypothetical protein [Planctomycetaceae bacterium]